MLALVNNFSKVLVKSNEVLFMHLFSCALGVDVFDSRTARGGLANPLINVLLTFCL